MTATMKIYAQHTKDSTPELVYEETHKHKIECNSGEEYCEKIHFHSDSFTSDDYYFMTLQISKSEVSNTEVGELVLSLSAVSRHYTFFEIMWKIFFIFFSCVMLIIFMLVFKQYPFKEWLFEIKWTFVLLVLLVIHNNPFYAYEYILDSYFFEYLNVMFNSLFYVFLLLFILITFEFYRYGKGTKKLKYWIPRLIFFVLFFIAVMTVFCYNKAVGVDDPHYDPLTDVTSLVLAVVALLFILVLIFAYVYVVVRSCSDGAKIGNTRRKMRLFAFLTCLSLVLFFVLFALSLFFGAMQILSITLTLVAYVNLLAALIIIINLPIRGSEDEQWSDTRMKITRLDDMALYSQLPDDFTIDTNNDNDFNNGNEQFNDDFNHFDNKKTKSSSSSSSSDNKDEEMQGADAIEL